MINPTFKSRFWKLIRWSGVLFAVLFVFRIVYGFVNVEENDRRNYYVGASGSADFFSQLELRKNYASEKSSFKAPDQIQNASSQKYEKTGLLKTKSSEFENDEKSVREKTRTAGGVIQYEQSLGNKGDRELHVSIGVDPESFDSFYTSLKSIGNVHTTEVTKIDKTNEYRQLNAKKASLEKTLASLNELKSRAGQINDFVGLHDKILDTETKLQELGVELGNFNTENEFCTVRFSLYEGQAEKGISIIHRIKVALEWSIQYFAIIVFTILALSAAAFIVLLIVDKLKILSKVNE